MEHIIVLVDVLIANTDLILDLYYGVIKFSHWYSSRNMRNIVEDCVKPTYEILEPHMQNYRCIWMPLWIIIKPQKV